MKTKNNRIALIFAVATVMVLFCSAAIFAEIVPNTYDLNIGSQCPGGCITDIVTLTNGGDNTETVNSYAFSYPGFGSFSVVDSPDLPYTLETGSSVDFIVQFCPPFDTMYVNTLNFFTSVNDVYVNLIGDGYGSCTYIPLEVYPEDRQWNVVTEVESATSSLWLKNSVKITNPVGNPPVSIDPINFTYLGPGSAYFSIDKISLLYPEALCLSMPGNEQTPWGCPFLVTSSPIVLDPGVSLIIDLRFQPEELGLFESILHVNTDVPGPDATINIALTGESLESWTSELARTLEPIADEEGIFVVTIQANEDKGEPIIGWTVENMSNIGSYFINPEVGEEISIYGRLEDATSPGSLDLYVDPEGILIKYEMSISPYSSIKTVAIDIKPGSDPNSIHCINRNAIIAVAILTTGDFDATTVDHTTVTFAGANEIHLSDQTGEPRRHEEDVDGDGDIDLVLHFRMSQADMTCDSIEGTLNGQTFSGQTITGTDTIRMVGGEG